MATAIKIVMFVLGTAGIVWVSRASLGDVRSHGFYRFFSWISLLALFLINVDYWFSDPFSLRQIISWFFLILSLVFIIQGVRLLHGKGKLDKNRADPGLVGIEKTTKLVTTGIYRLVRHPFYSSLLLLGWGIYLKRISWTGAVLVVSSTVFLFLTAKIEERENIRYFGETYREYMKKTKMFIPFVF